jgi:hypothetical protein
MATLQQIIDFLNRKYPSHGESNANIVLDLDRIHKDVYMRLRRLSNDYKTHDIDTIADQRDYALPTTFKIEDVNKVEVSLDEDGTQWESYEYRGVADIDINGRYYGRAKDGKIFIIKDTRAITADNLIIRLYYFPRPVDLTTVSLAQVPELDVDYHDLLNFGIVQEMASQGHNPDIEIANYYQQKFDEKLQTIKSDISGKLSKAPLRIPQVKERW